MGLQEFAEEHGGVNRPNWKDGLPPEELEAILATDGVISARMVSKYLMATYKVKVSSSAINTFRSAHR